ncbi:MAG TPA: DNA polymerase III subunit psi [Methylophaga sp.]|nr:DNA polymerase III subunit psi [Methylophaga sp.]
MQLSEQKRWTLEKLGISIWQRRENTGLETNAELAIPARQVSVESETTQAQFNSDTELLICCSETQSPAEQQLMANIFKTLAELGLRIEQCDAAVLPSLPANLSVSPQILIFGDLPLELLPDLRSHCNLLPSPADLIKQPSRKADVWAVICQLQQHLR